MATIGKISCEICGCEQLYHVEDKAAKPTKCKRCGNIFGSGTFVSETNPKASPTTHNMVRWGCRDCNHYGVSWLSKKMSRLKECPNCHVGYVPGRLRCRRTKDHGDCATIWQPVDGRTRPPVRTTLPKKRYQCGNCGYIQRYLVRPKSPCPRCERPAEVNHA